MLAVSAVITSCGASGFLLGSFVRGGKFRVVPTVGGGGGGGGHDRCAACSLEGGVGVLPQNF